MAERGFSTYDAINGTSGPPDEFYVGYLPIPSGLKAFVRIIVAAMVLFAVGVAMLLSRSQNNPGDAVWDDATSREFVGLVEMRPYPLIHVANDAGSVETLLLVEVGKFGGGQRAAAFDGRAASVRGWLLERDGRRMIEMEPGVAIREADERDRTRDERAGRPRSDRSHPELTAEQPSQTQHQVTLRGEIVDSKCYLGAMKPGDGKTHKACATLCIAGGIPPMFVTIDERGRRSYYLLTDPAGGPLDQRVLPFVADPVEISGVVEQRGDLRLLQIEPGALRRL
ncbi:MAG: hypothetical protein U1D55_05450 [Phycisphaerae bacterium]